MQRGGLKSPPQLFHRSLLAPFLCIDMNLETKLFVKFINNHYWIELHVAFLLKRIMFLIPGHCRAL